MDERYHPVRRLIGETFLMMILYRFPLTEKIIEGVIPKCEECNEGVVKPDIVFFGEMLPDRFQMLADRDFDQADLLIIMGSSLVVQPFASLVDRCVCVCVCCRCMHCDYP